MSIVKKDNPDVIVVDKEYLRDTPEEMSNRVLRDSSVVLMLYEPNDTLYNYPHMFKRMVMHNCEDGNGKVQTIEDSFNEPTLFTCEYCNKTIRLGKRYGEDPIYTTQLAKMVNGTVPTKFDFGETVMFLKHPSIENAVIVKLFKSAIKSVTDKETGEIKMVSCLDLKSALEIIPGISIKGYKILKNTIKEVPAFEALAISPQNAIFHGDRKFLFEDANNIYEFLIKNKIFFDRTGFSTALQYMSFSKTFYIEPFSVLHLCLISEFPILEQLLKSGFVSLYYELIANVQNTINKKDIARKIQKFSGIFAETSKGSMALRIPSYICNYLRTKVADINEYITWCNIYERQNLSREQFEKYISTPEYFALATSGAISYMPKIMKYGYTIEQATKYVFKQTNYIVTRKEEHSDNVGNYMGTAITFYDYLQICEMLELNVNKFPSNIQQAHDEVMILKQTKDNETVDKSINLLGTKTQSYLNGFIDEDNLTKMEEEYAIVVPKSIADFIEEGNMQNNCVGHYIHNVGVDSRIVFFVRKQEDVSKSYITAEYVPNIGLSQCMYANNRPVIDKDILGYCTTICNRIERGISSGKI